MTKIKQLDGGQISGPAQIANRNKINELVTEVNQLNEDLGHLIGVLEKYMVGDNKPDANPNEQAAIIINTDNLSHSAKENIKKAWANKNQHE
jgi:hypothetical protein